MGKLTAAEIDEYFDKHLPYRTRIMLAHYKMTHDGTGKPARYNDDPARLDACFIAALVTARMYLNVLGVGKNRGALASFADGPDDVTVDDLNGRRVDIGSLSTAEHKLVLEFLVMADKAAAHFTKPFTHDWSVIHDVIHFVHARLKTHLYDTAGKQGLSR